MDSRLLSSQSGIVNCYLWDTSVSTTIINLVAGADTGVLLAAGTYLLKENYSGGGASGHLSVGLRPGGGGVPQVPAAQPANGEVRAYLSPVQTNTTNQTRSDYIILVCSVACTLSLRHNGLDGQVVIERLGDAG